MSFTHTGNLAAPYYGGGQVTNPANVIVGTIAPPTTANSIRIGEIYIRPGIGAYIAINNTGSSGVVTWSALGTGAVVNVAGATTTLIANGRSGVATYTAPAANVAGGATVSLTLTNSLITAASVIQLSVSGGTLGSGLSIGAITPGAGTVTFALQNATGATANAASVNITYQLLN